MVRPPLGSNLSWKMRGGPQVGRNIKQINVMALGIGCFRYLFSCFYVCQGWGSPPPVNSDFYWDLGNEPAVALFFCDPMDRGDEKEHLRPLFRGQRGNLRRYSTSKICPPLSPNPCREPCMSSFGHLVLGDSRPNKKNKY